MEQEYGLDKLQVGDRLFKYVFGNVYRASYIEKYIVAKVNKKTYRIRNMSTEDEKTIRKDKLANHGYERFNQAKYDAIQKERLIGDIKGMGYDIRYDEKIAHALYNMKRDEVVRYYAELKDLMNRILKIRGRK